MSKLRNAWLWFRYFPAVFFFGVGLIALSQLGFVLGLILIALSVGCFMPQKIDEFFIARAFKKSPYRNVEYSVRLSNNGFSAESEIDKATINWGVFTGATVFEDGVLLQRGANVVNWIPRDAFVSPQDWSNAKEILSGKLALKHAVVRPSVSQVDGPKRVCR